MKRFYHEKSHTLINPLVSALLFLLIYGGFYLGMHFTSAETDQKQTEILHAAIAQSIAHCYATEGHYPENLEYLKEHYGIRYNSEKYFVDYQVLGENIFPDVTIIKK